MTPNKTLQIIDLLSKLMLSTNSDDIRDWADDTAYLGKIAKEATQEVDETSKLLGSLLAVLHRDGGHFQATHGTAKACAVAETSIHMLRAIRTPLTKNRVDEILSTCTPSGYGKSIYDIVREVELKHGITDRPGV